MQFQLHTGTPKPQRPVRLARVLRDLSGTPSAWRQRRGSFLVLVVGTLALLAVVMLVYVSVGNQDEHTRAALKKRDTLDDVPQQFRDYIAEKIIAADALDTIFDDVTQISGRTDVPATLAATEPALSRELTDYGFTPWEMVSEGAAALQYSSGPATARTLVFTPTGGYIRPRRDLQAGGDAVDISPNVDPASALPTYWPPSDPWLASNEPTALAYTGLDQFYDANAKDSNANSPGYAFKPSSIKQSWAHISNIAPDGKFVNLYNLAPVVNGKRRANFKALPGFGTVTVPGVGVMPRLSESLSLFTTSSTDPRDQNYTSGLTTDFGVTIGAARQNHPAVWDSRQLGIYRPAKEWRQSVSADYRPGGKYYLLYSYADADGDGMIDSRWQELTESRDDPDNPINFIQTDGKYRYFIAARIIDASGKINVNTATDLTAAPSRQHLVGLTPADVDLLRLLQNRDAYERMAFFAFPPALITGFSIPTDPNTNTLTAAYDAIPGPIGPGSDGDPQKYAPVTGQAPQPDLPYWPPAVGDGYNLFRALSTGQAAYTALRISVATDAFLPQAAPDDPTVEISGVNLMLEGARAEFYDRPVTPPQIYQPRDPLDPFGRRFWDFAATPWDSPPANAADGVLFASATMPALAGLTRPFGATVGDPHNPPVAAYPDFSTRRAEFYWLSGGRAGEVFADFGRNANQFEMFVRTAAAFGMDDMAELLTYAGVNDPEVRSKLEATTVGRDNYPRTTANRPINTRQSRTARFDPLRSNRGGEYEFARDRDVSGPEAGLADLDARILLDTSIRGHITTVSGSRPLKPVRDVAFAGLGAEEVKIDIRDQLAQTRPVVPYANTRTGGPPTTTPASPALSPNSQTAIALATNRIFHGYCDALLPYSGMDGGAAWDATDANFYKRRTMFYGYKGPELAIYAAAHMTLNMVDMADDERSRLNDIPPPATGDPLAQIQDNRPSAFTLLLTEDARTRLQNQDPTDYTQWPWWKDGNQLDLNFNELTPGKFDQRLPVDATDNTLVAPAANIYGVEAQPFLASVSVFTVYADMPDGKGPRNAGDPDTGGDLGDDDGFPNIGRDITLRRDVSRRNPDLMYRVLAFQLTNPFGHTIRLGDRASAYRQANGSRAAAPTAMADWDVADPNFPPLDTEEDFYYIEFGGRFFKLSKLEEQVKPGQNYDQVLTGGLGLDTTMGDITIGPGETIVCYALSQAPRVIYKTRLKEAEPTLFQGGTPPPTQAQYAEAMRLVFQTQFERNVPRTIPYNPKVKSYWIPEFDARSAADGGTGAIGVRADDGYEPGSPGTRLRSNDPPLFGLWSAPDNDSNGVNFLGGRYAFDPLLFRHDNSGEAAPNATDVPPENQVVKLWRAMRSGDGRSTNPAAQREHEATPGVRVPATTWDQDSPTSASTRVLVRNARENDLLADRLRVPIEETGSPRVNLVMNLDARLYNSNPGQYGRNVDVPDTSSDDGEPWDGRTTATLAVCAGARRPIEPAFTFAITQLPKGALPAYCLERKDPGDYTAATPRPAWNIYEQSLAGAHTAGQVNWEGVDGSDFATSGGGGTFIGDATFGDWIYNRASTDDLICVTTKYLPTEYNPDSQTDFRLHHRGTLVRDAVGEPRFDLDFRLSSAERKPYRDLYAEVVLANNNFTAPATISPTPANQTSTLRVGDVLLPLGIGPTHVPFATGATASARTPEDQAWTTFGESMSAALGYDMFVRTVPSYAKRDAHSLLRPIDVRANASDPPTWVPMFDRGNLRLDAFVPFFDANGTAAGRPIYQGPEFSGAGNDERRGNGIPLALNVFDIFSANVSGVDPRDSRRRQPESLTRAVPGLININTAPLAVTRCLPMVSPSGGYRDSEGSPFFSSTFYVNILPPNPNVAGQRTFDLSFTVPGGRGTASIAGIPRGAPAALVQEAIESSPAVGKGNVSVSPGWVDPANPTARLVDYVITFVGDLSYAPITGFAVPNGQDTTRVAPAARIPSAAIQPGVNWWASGRQIDQSSDIGATMIAYRDKLPTLLRPDAWHRRIEGTDLANRTSSVNAARWITVADFRDVLNSCTPDDTLGRTGRQWQTNIFGLNEQPGFPSVGSLMTVRHYGLYPTIASDPTDPTDVATRDQYKESFRNSMDFMGYPADYLLALPAAGGSGRAQDSSRIGVDSVLYGSAEPLPAMPADPIMTDSIENEFKEKLAVANALSNVVTTRSDYFICWFVIHGYQQTDLENLAPDDPIVPSVARRFLMVVDRSNVVKRGDKPRILLFKELPYKPS